MTEEKKRLIIIDSNALIHRAYHALPPLTTRKGELVNAVYGFLLVFFKALKELKPDYVVATFDLPAPTFRHEKFVEYKAKRPKAPDELYNQIPIVKKFLEVFGVPVFEKEGFEADDIIGTISKKSPKKLILPEVENIILSGDLDTLQLIDENTKVYTLRKGLKDTVLYDEKQVLERYGFEPSKLVDFRALKGDPSDNIPGVPGIGEKTAVELIKEFGSIEELYKDIEENSEKSKKISQKIREKLINSKEQAFFSKFLSQIREDVPIDFNLGESRSGEYNPEKVKALLREYEFYSLLNKLPEAARPIGTGKSMSIGEKENILEEIEKLYREGVFSSKIYEIERALAPVVEEIKKNGIKIDILQLKSLSEKLGLEIRELEDKIFAMTGAVFNINSPQQLSEILFKRLKIPTGGLKKTPAGAISTSWQELEKLKEKHPIIKFLEDYRELFKLKSGFVDALPELAGEDGRLHPEFHQLGTVTGRFSCSEPNLQNVPIRGKWGKEIRKAFVAEKGFKLISADYSQMELRIAASISRDKKMQEIFRKDGDIHKMTASQVLGISEEKVDEEKRRIAKTLNFGTLYGISVPGFAEAAGISNEEAKKFMENYKKSFSGIAKYVEDSVKKAREMGYAETFFGRKRFLPEINSIDFQLRRAAERMAINMPIQGTAADIIKMAMIESHKEIKILRDQGKMILQIHDELLFETPRNKVEKIAEKIKKAMENIAEFETSLKVDIKVGDSWGNLEEIVV